VSKWNEFPYVTDDFDFAGANLKKAWKKLHAGDGEPFPEDAALQEAWRSYHYGEFEAAVKQADAIGIKAHAVANKATGIYATYLEEDENRKIALFKTAIERAEKAIKAFPDDPNAHYFHAFNLGRYSQSISIVKALKQGVGGKIAQSLKAALDLNPKHADAHIAMGMYHAEIIDKVGKMLGSVTYGASEKEALKHFDIALKLAPDAPITYIEYANGLYLLFGDGRLDEVTDLYIKASEMTPRDAMETLDVAAAQAELE
jgi:tetratricopeptide (TPR) repeat protein